MAARQAPLSLGFSRQEHWSRLPFPSPMHESEKWKGSRSVMSDSCDPHGPQPTRLLCLQDSPGKNTGVGCHFLLQFMKVESEIESEVTQSCPTLSGPMDCSLPGSSIHGIFQARGLEWGAIAFSDKPTQYQQILDTVFFLYAITPRCKTFTRWRLSLTNQNLRILLVLHLFIHSYIHLTNIWVTVCQLLPSTWMTEENGHIQYIHEKCRQKLIITQIYSCNLWSLMWRESPSSMRLLIREI